MAGGIEFSGGKFKELVLLLADRSSGDPRMSRVKLNKLLYRADFEAYRQLGRSITGATYIKGEHGPMASELPLAEHELGARGLLNWKGVPAGPHTQKIPVATEPADPTQFSDEELEVISQALRELLPLGGKGAKEWSHETSAGWQAAEPNQEIPYETARISTERPPEKIFRYFRKLHGLTPN